LLFEPERVRRYEHKCAVSFVNFGQWPLSFSSGKTTDNNSSRPYTATEYAKAVKELFARIPLEVTNFKTRFFWVDSNAHPPNDMVRQGRDWRSLHPLRLFNQIAKQAARRVGIPVVRVHEMAEVLSELSFDSHHYMAPVEREIARIVLQFYLTATDTHKLI
jgi:hypothetical protein